LNSTVIDFIIRMSVSRSGIPLLRIVGAADGNPCAKVGTATPAVSNTPAAAPIVQHLFTRRSFPARLVADYATIRSFGSGRFRDRPRQSV
jgi:hypothetical protein